MSFRIRDTSYQQPDPETENKEKETAEHVKIEGKPSKKKKETSKISSSSRFQMKYDPTNQCDHF